MASRLPVKPSGLETEAKGGSNGPERNRSVTPSSAPVTPSSQTTGRQRREGSRPSGKSRSGNASSGATASPGKAAASFVPGSGSAVACRP